MYTLKQTPPIWVNSVTCFIFKSRLGQTLILSILDPKTSILTEDSSEANKDLRSHKRKNVTWKYVILLINWLALISIFLIYFLLIIFTLPYSSDVSLSYLKENFPEYNLSDYKIHHVHL